MEGKYKPVSVKKHIRHLRHVSFVLLLGVAAAFYMAHHLKTNSDRIALRDLTRLNEAFEDLGSDWVHRAVEHKIAESGLRPTPPPDGSSAYLQGKLAPVRLFLSGQTWYLEAKAHKKVFTYWNESMDTFGYDYPILANPKPNNNAIEFIPPKTLSDFRSFWEWCRREHRIIVSGKVHEVYSYPKLISSGHFYSPRRSLANVSRPPFAPPTLKIENKERSIDSDPWRGVNLSDKDVIEKLQKRKCVPLYWTKISVSNVGEDSSTTWMWVSPYHMIGLEDGLAIYRGEECGSKFKPITIAAEAEIIEIPIRFLPRFQFLTHFNYPDKPFDEVFSEWTELVRKYPDMELDLALKFLQLKSELPTFEIFGFSVRLEWGGNLGIIFLLAISCYYALILARTNNIMEKFNRIPLGEPWLGLQNAPLARLAILILTFLLPVFAAGWICYEVRSLFNCVLAGFLTFVCYATWRLHCIILNRVKTLSTPPHAG